MRPPDPTSSGERGAGAAILRLACLELNLWFYRLVVVAQVLQLRRFRRLLCELRSAIGALGRSVLDAVLPTLGKLEPVIAQQLDRMLRANCAIPATEVV